MSGIDLRVVVAAALLLGCAMKPQVLREKLDECDQFGFDALVYSRERDGAVIRVLCVPKEEDVDHEVRWSINRWLPLLRGKSHPQDKPGGQPQQ